MKKTFLMLCLSAVGAAWAFTCQAADMTLAERHAKNGIRCEACHNLKVTFWSHVFPRGWRNISRRRDITG